MTWQADATGAVREAMALRARLGYGPATALCPFDVARRLNVELWFQASPSMEGLYVPGRPPRVVVNSLRPAGRQRYTAAHELGHHEYGHGASLDAELNDNTREEFIANRFARALLMPKLAVANAYQRRGWDPRHTSAAQAFIVAQDLGVGFTSLLDNMSLTLRLLDTALAQQLAKTRLPGLRAEIARRAVDHDLFPVDSSWGSRPLDIEVGDAIMLLSAGESGGDCLCGDGDLIRAERPGEAVLRLERRQEEIRVRVSRRAFVGRSIYRHLEDPDE